MGLATNNKPRSYKTVDVHIDLYVYISNLKIWGLLLYLHTKNMICIYAVYAFFKKDDKNPTSHFNIQFTLCNSNTMTLVCITAWKGPPPGIINTWASKVMLLVY